MRGRNLARKINGKMVIAASRKITLHISPLDIKSGAKKAPGTCAAAKAAVREVPNCTMARVHLGRAYIFNDKKDHWLAFKTPGALRTEIVAFDRGGKFEPGEYHLSPIPQGDLDKKRKTFVSSDTNRSVSATGRAKKLQNRLKQPRKLHVVKGVREHAYSNRG